MTEELQTFGLFDSPLPDDETWELAGVGAEDLLDAVEFNFSDITAED